MPITGDYTWEEYNDHIEVIIPLKGVSPKSVDVFTASSLLKVSYSPYLLDLNLTDDIDDNGSRAVIKNGELIVFLKKRVVRQWGQLCFIGSKKEAHQRRWDALQKREETIKRQIENIASKKVEEERGALQRHMALEKHEQMRLDDIKVNEKKNAENALYDALGPLNEVQQASADDSTRPFAHHSDLTNVVSINAGFETRINKRLDSQVHIEKYDDKDMLPEREIPLPRLVVETSFFNTPRLFKTPSRESTIKREQEFIIKNSGNLKNNALLNKIGIGEADPVWLNAKGDEFFNRGDFRSAINAYTEALRQDDTFFQVFGKRAACYLNLREGVHCVKDCSAALDRVMKAQLSTAEESQFIKEIYTRSALAHCLIGDFTTGMDHFAKARAMDETDKYITESMRHLALFMEASQWKMKADKKFAEGNLLEARELYSKALEVEPTYLKALINRAACFLALSNHSGCVNDCNLALSQLKSKPQNINPLFAILFPKSNLQRKWIVTVLCHRAIARQHINDIQGGIEDLEEALETVQPNDEVDIKGIKTKIDLLRKMGQS